VSPTEAAGAASVGLPISLDGIARTTYENLSHIIGIVIYCISISRPTDADMDV